MSNVDKALCCVCLDDYPLERFRVIVCGHTFCTDCTSSLANSGSKCPECRSTLHPRFPRNQKSIPFYINLSSIEAGASRPADISSDANPSTSGPIDAAAIKQNTEHMQQISRLVESLLANDEINPKETGILEAIKMQTATWIAALCFLNFTDTDAYASVEHVMNNTMVAVLQTPLSLTQHTSHLNEMLENHRAERDSAMEQNSSLQLENRKLSAKASSAEAEREVAKLQTKLETQQQQIAALQDGEKAAAMSNDDLRERNDELNKLAAVLQHNVEELEEAERGWRRQRTAMRKQESSVMTELQTVRLQRNTAMGRERREGELMAQVEDLHRKLDLVSRAQPAEAVVNASKRFRAPGHSEASALRDQTLSL